MRRIAYMLLPLCCYACSPNTALQEELKSAQSTVSQQEEIIDSLQALLVAESKQKLVHVVYFKLKDDLLESDQKTIIDEIEKIEAIPVLSNLKVGKFQDLGDQRAMSDFGIVMQMDFENEEDYKAYQQHPIHLALKTAIVPYLGGAPVTYDYWTIK
jgi:hypothetical protein